MMASRFLRELPAHEIRVGDEIAYGLQYMKVETLKETGDRIAFRGSVQRKGRPWETVESCHRDAWVSCYAYRDDGSDHGPGCDGPYNCVCSTTSSTGSTDGFS